MSKQIDYEVLATDLGLKNVLQKFQEKLLETLNCVKVGKIKTFYADKQTADIQIDGYPQISGVPVSFISGGDFSIQVPIKEGDDCIVLFCDTDLDNWVEGKGSEPAFPNDKHGLNGAIALLGLTNLKTKVSDYITDGVRVKYKGTILELKENGISSNKDVSINGNLNVSGNISADGDIVSGGNMEAGNGATGTFTNTDGGSIVQTVTVVKGIITQIS